MPAANLHFSSERSVSDPDQVAVLIVGQLTNLKQLSFDHVRSNLHPKVDDQAWTGAMSALKQCSADPISLYLNRVVLSCLPGKCSRHNTPSGAHALTKQVKSFTSSGRKEVIIVVCERGHVFASACAVARAFPLFSRKTKKLADQGDKTECSESTSYDVTVEFICVDKQPVTADDVDVMTNAAYGVRLAARITDTPCSEMFTTDFVQEAVQVAKQLALKKEPLIIEGEKLKQLGFGGIYNVGKAASHPPALVVLSHEPQGAVKTVAWVGKGIVYDTGGLSIKGKTQMPGMKRDCGGAAGILGAFYAAVKQGFKENLHAVFCLAENAVSANAMRPDDIITMYSGKTVEVNNTDAEGRLVVSDGVVYAQRDLKADIIVDMCTLTGAQAISTGKFHAAHLSNCQRWEELCAHAGRTSGDLSFPIVYCPELHFQEFSSAMADMKNSVADRSNALSSCAGLFINAHLGFDFPGAWLHIDMAAPVHSGERATGFGVALLNSLFGEFSGSPLLKEASPSLQQPNEA